MIAIRMRNQPLTLTAGGLFPLNNATTYTVSDAFGCRLMPSIGFQRQFYITFH